MTFHSSFWTSGQVCDLVPIDDAASGLSFAEEMGALTAWIWLPATLESKLLCRYESKFYTRENRIVAETKAFF
jgi:hypothetical protein